MESMKWYEKPLVVLLLCIMLPPVGLVIAWRRTKQSRGLIAFGAFTTFFLFVTLFVKEPVSNTPIEEGKGLTARHLQNLTRSDILDPNITDKEMEWFLNRPSAQILTHRGLKLIALDSESIPNRRTAQLLGLVDKWQDILDPFIGHIVYTYGEDNLFKINVYLRPEYITDHPDHYDKLRYISAESYLINKNVIKELTVWVYSPFHINGTTDMDSKHFQSYAYNMTFRYFSSSNSDGMFSIYEPLDPHGYKIFLNSDGQVVFESEE